MEIKIKEKPHEPITEIKIQLKPDEMENLKDGFYYDCSENFQKRRMGTDINQVIKIEPVNPIQFRTMMSLVSCLDAALKSYDLEND